MARRVLDAELSDAAAERQERQRRRTVRRALAPFLRRRRVPAPCGWPRSSESEERPGKRTSSAVMKDAQS